MIIGISGYGHTGASAAVGLIKECEGVQSYKYGGEFQLLQQPDGLLDLYHYLVEDQRRISTSTIIGRYKNNMKIGRERGIQKEIGINIYNELNNQYIEKLIQIKWDGYSLVDSADQRNFLDHTPLNYINRGFRRILKKTKVSSIVWPPDRKRYYSALSDEEFTTITKNFLSEILSTSKFDINKPILLEQLFPPTAPTDGMQFFDNAASIIIDRDPRDLYLITNYIFPHEARFMPNKGDVHAFIAYYKGLHRRKSLDQRVRYIQFEDLIYKYENTKNSLLSWLNLQHSNPKLLFNPEQSINNTCIYKSYNNRASEIKEIEKELSDFLYPFEEAEKNINFSRDNKKAFLLKPGDARIHRKD